VRVETPSPLVHAALVTEGVNLSSNALPAIYVLQQALGGMSFVQNGSNSSSRILKAASAVTGQPFTVSATLLALVFGYEDCQYFCVYDAFTASTHLLGIKKSMRCWHGYVSRARICTCSS